ncbi:MAG: S-layer homology domain-containing protein, partial [Candidatus Eremiobacterota bacterium]
MLNRILGSMLAVLLVTGGVRSAPLGGPEPPVWVRDALAVLVERGLVEGYPDGTFKGDRAASRWEVATLVARLLARMEQEHASFATRQDLEQVRRLAQELAPELSALGVRVDNLERASERLDKRVTELERIRFYGSVVTRVGGQSIRSAGSPGMGTVINYQQAVGTAEGAGGPLQPPSPLTGQQWGLSNLGILATIDFVLGRPVTSGFSFTSVGTLGLEALLSEELKGGLELKAYTSQGDSVVDAYYGVEAPYLANPFTAAQPGANQPFSRLTLDHVWLNHEPSRTRVRL